MFSISIISYIFYFFNRKLQFTLIFNYNFFNVSKFF